MHTIEPFYDWRDYYMAETDEKSPFYKREYSQFEFHNMIYNYYIHPQWDDFGSPTLYSKILFVDYQKGFAIIELLGEWNDAIHNDIMFLKREIIDVLILNGIYRYILIGENVLNFHASDDCYYEEWWDDIKEHDGWIAAINFREHVMSEMKKTHLDYYIHFEEPFHEVNWRAIKPFYMHKAVESLLPKQIG
jgi:hypothetical protein